jgi:GTPase SAR1 family protein
MDTAQNPELQLAFDFIQFTNRNVFLTGKAGTGKTTFLHNLKRSSPKRMIVVAPTGVAAINAGGVTIHSFFQLAFHPHIPSSPEEPSQVGRSLASGNFKMSREKVNIIKSLDLLVIDEISMVRADLLDAVDSILRRYKNHLLPFGGVQLLMIGDLQQLAPVVKDEDWEILGKYYHTAFFFGSLALQQTDYITIELRHVYRQKDLSFITLLNKIRDNQLDSAALQELNKRYDPEFDPDSNGGYITLTTHNAQAQSLNDSRLLKLPGKVRTFKAKVKDDFPEFAYPTAFELHLKTGAQVMFVKNDISKEKLYFNGKIGKIVDIDEDVITVQCPDDADNIQVEKVEWQNMKYTLDDETKEIQETVIGTFTQYPLKLAWAITIHKSQGLTFDKVIIDARAAFAHGQVYVALSRCRTLEGIVLSTPVSQRGIITDPTVSGFVGEIEKNHPDQDVLIKSRKIYQHFLLKELFDFSPIQKQAYYCLKLVKEHRAGILGNIESDLPAVIEQIKNDLTGVSGKFYPQLHNLILSGDNAETNLFLQERVSKACSFFTGKIADSVQQKLDNIQWQSDNKEIRKSVTEAMERLRNEIGLKYLCLQSCTNGFIIRTYLEAKAKSAIETPAVKAKPARPVDDFSGIVRHPGLFNKLKAWRDRKALETKLPHYMILPQKTMAALVTFLPQSQEALVKVKGMGKKKSEQFGSELLGIIQTYIIENKIESSSIPLQVERPAAKQKKDTRLLSFNLYKEGKTVEQIARERDMAVSTIDGHLAHFVGTGELSVNDFVPSDLTALIAENIDDNDFRMGPVKSALGDQISWSELRYVMKHLEHLKKTNTAS